MDPLRFAHHPTFMSDGGQGGAPLEKGRREAKHAASPSNPQRTRSFFRRILRSPAGPAGSVAKSSAEVQYVTQLCRELLSERGDTFGSQLAGEIVSAYHTLSTRGREAFFSALKDQFSPDSEGVAQAADLYRRLPSAAALVRLQAAVESPRQELFRRVNLTRAGLGMLIEMRRHLLSTLDQHPEQAEIDTDLTHLFKSWFNGGFLVLQRIDWRTSAIVLERLIQFEAVHQIHGWTDLRRRLENDRRCYALFHPSLPDQPLIFVEVALTLRISAKIQPLLDPGSVVIDPAQARCAIFYSITNCYDGLRGVSFGSQLIKHVLNDLRRSLPRVRTFATLSPIPGFRKWLFGALSELNGDKRADELRALVTALNASSSIDTPVTNTLRNELMGACAHYLINAKLATLPIDPVARFHLANGACLERLSWMGDVSEIGRRRSLGLMANYIYRLSDVERNHEIYAGSHGVASSRRLKWLARQSLFASASEAPRLSQGRSALAMTGRSRPMRDE
jgi:malonyl-CoA decarboxylase